MGMMIWLGVTGIFWAVVLTRHCSSEKECRGYRDLDAERQDKEDAACAWVLMWALSGWMPCGAWVIIS